MIEHAIFEHNSGFTFEFNTNQTPMTSFTTEIQIRGNGQDKARQHGAWPYFGYLGERVFRGEGDILMDASGEYIQSRLDMLKALRLESHLDNRVCGRLILELTGQEEMEAYCTLDSYPEMPMEALSPARGAYMVALRSFDPRVYSTSEYTSSADLTVSSGGRVYNKTFNKTYPGTAYAGGDLVLTNGGNAETLPTIDVYGPVVGPYFAATIGSKVKTVELASLTVPSGDIATISFADRTATMDDGTELDSYFTRREWWYLEPGNTTVAFRAAESSGTARAVFRWKNAYFI
jgi:hypothetical protein